MPIYEYDCPKCGVFEEIQKVSDEALTKCPKCGNGVKRLVSESKFVLCGGGWASDGYQKRKC